MRIQTGIEKRNKRITKIITHLSESTTTSSLASNSTHQTWISYHPAVDHQGTSCPLTPLHGSTISYIATLLERLAPDFGKQELSRRGVDHSRRKVLVKSAQTFPPLHTCQSPHTFPMLPWNFPLNTAQRCSSYSRYSFSGRVLLTQPMPR